MCSTKRFKYLCATQYITAIHIRGAYSRSLSDMINAHTFLLGTNILMKKKSFLQKTSLVTGVISELLCVLCIVMLVIKAQELGMEDVISASYMASAFFFFTTGLVLIIISKANVPSFSFDDSDDK